MTIDELIEEASKHGMIVIPRDGIDQSLAEAKRLTRIIVEAEAHLEKRKKAQTKKMAEYTKLRRQVSST